MEHCWASSLGDCEGGVSREHYVSECVYPNQPVYVQGFNWCLNEPKLFQRNALTAKILCISHNKRLGNEVDIAGCDAYRQIRDFTKLRRERARDPSIAWAARHFIVDGPSLERWCLKTLLNFAVVRKLVIGPGDGEPGIVSADIVRTAFGLERFTDGRGLYIAFRENETFEFSDHFKVSLKTQGQNLLMGHLFLHGFRFYMNLLPSGILSAIENSNVYYRQARFVDPVERIEGDGDASIESLLLLAQVRIRQDLSIIWPSEVSSG